MSIEPTIALIVVSAFGLALTGGTLALKLGGRPGSGRGGWEVLRQKVDGIVAEIDSSDCPKPTHRMCEFLMAGEDHRFYSHPGVDPIAMCRAIWKTVFCDCRQGGSTIAMQLVRTVTRRYEWTCRRKLVEIILAVRLTRHLGRERLPVLYLWVAYYGWGMNNFTQACSRTLIDPLSASDLESALLVARLKYPEPRCLHQEHLRRIYRRASHLMSLRSAQNNRPISLLFNDDTV